MKMSLHNFDLELIKASIPTECQSHNNSLTPVVKMAEDFSLYCDYKSSSGPVGVFLSPHIVPTFTHGKQHRRVIRAKHGRSRRYYAAIK